MANRGKISKAGRRQRGSSKRQQSESHTDKLERLLQEAEKRFEEAEIQTQKTTLAQYLELVETRLVAHVRVREPLDLTSLHRITANVWDDRRLYPHKVRRWDTFDEEHNVIFDGLIAQEGDQQKYPCRATCQTIVRPLDLRSEAQLSQVAFAYLETPTRAILDQIWADENCTAEARAATVHQKNMPTVWIDKCWWFVTGGKFPGRTILISEEKCAHLVTLNDVKSLESLEYRRGEEPSTSTARLLLQAFTYMVNCGVAYAYAYSGPICLFLKIDPSNIETLYVHAIYQPLDEEGHQALPQKNIKDTICAKLLTLLTLARSSKPLPPDWVRDSIKTLKSTLPASLDLGISVSAHAQYPGSPKKLMYAQDYRKPEAFFCSQACLLGLQVGGQLDEECPNFLLHRQGTDTTKHCVNARQVTEITRLQLLSSLSHNVSTLGLDFANTVSYKITINNYGYTFRAKGVVETSYMSLGHEAGLYDMLKGEQGDTIPVYIGYFHLNQYQGYMFEGVAEINGFLLVSNVGDMSDPAGRTQDLSGEVERLSSKLKAAGFREPPPQRLIVYDEPLKRYMYRDLTMIPGMID